MTLTEFIEKWGQTLLETPLATVARPDDPPELAEIRHAVLDQIRGKSYRAGAAKVFPYDLIRISMRGVEDSRAAVFSGRFFRKYLEAEIQNCLRADGTRFPGHLRVDVDVAAGLPRPGEAGLVIEVGSQEQKQAARRAARLVVREGAASTPVVLIEKARINIGREVDVYRSKGLYRRNDLAFVEDTEINRSVSREHAHIQFDRVTGEHRLFSDRWYDRGGECGTWIIRDGMSHEVPRDTRGARLEPGDEIHFGRAVVIFEAD